MAKHKTPLLDQLESGPWPSFVSDLKALAEERTKNPKKIDFQVPVDVVDDLLGLLELSFKDGAHPLEARRHRRRVRVRRRRHRPLLRPAGDVPGCRPLPHHARQPARRQVLHHRVPAQSLRPVGPARQRHHQHARLHRRHHLPGHHARISSKRSSSSSPTSSTRTSAVPAPTCARPRTASVPRAASTPATTPRTCASP